jgi:hypothetical protein
MSTLVAGVCAAALIPTATFAQQTCEQRQSHRVIGTVAGGGLGALAGSAIAGPGDRTEGAVIGGVAGALLGNQLSKSKADCTHAYGYYDDNGAWHANAVTQGSAQGYFDRTGAWVDGAPQGHYGRDGRWVRTDLDASAAGYFDANGLWVPASASGYYTTDGRWVAAAAPGYYDRSGRWVSTPTTGRYNADGQWISGQASGHRDANGVWVSDPQPGYYQNGRWIRGEAVGYYDAHGRWISTDDRPLQRADYTRYDSSRSVDQREADLARRIDRNVQTGRLSQADGRRAMRSLAVIEREERSLTNRRGGLNARGQATLHRKLDALDAAIGDDVRDNHSGRDGQYGRNGEHDGDAQYGRR